MRRVSLVISDVDGTLVTHDKVLTPRAIAAVQRLHDNGIGFSICSSRPPFGLRMMIEPLRLVLPFGGYNAGAIVEPDLSVVEQKLIPPDAAWEAVAMFQEHGIDCWVFVGNQWLIANPTGDHVDHELHTIQTPPTIVPAFEDAHFAAVGKIVGPSNDHDRVALVTELMQTALAGRVAVPQSEVLVLGDMENDLEMFRKAGFAVAMGNATDEVKGAAQATTLSNDEDGFAVAIERHVFGG